MLVNEKELIDRFDNLTPSQIEEYLYDFYELSSGFLDEQKFDPPRMTISLAFMRWYTIKELNGEQPLKTKYVGKRRRPVPETLTIWAVAKVYARGDSAYNKTYAAKHLGFVTSTGEVDKKSVNTSIKLVETALGEPVSWPKKDIGYLSELRNKAIPTYNHFLAKMQSAKEEGSELIPSVDWIKEPVNMNNISPSFILTNTHYEFSEFSCVTTEFEVTDLISHIPANSSKA